MFTGIVQGTGKIVSFRGNKSGGKLTVACGISLNGLKRGESVAVDGCCLTVVGHRRKSLLRSACKSDASARIKRAEEYHPDMRDSVVFDVSDETVRKTKVKSYGHGTVVNLERAMKTGDRFGGHFVLGHVDGVGRIERIRKNPGSVVMTVSYPKRLKPCLIDKGSIALDGISLTVALAGKNRFNIYIIPHTAKVTNMACKKAGDPVNLEGDMLGKYVERLIGKRL